MSCYPTVIKKLTVVCVLFAFAEALTSCTSVSKTESEIAKIPVDVKFYTFHKDFAAATPADLSKLKATYPKLLPTQTPDSVWTARLNGKDTIQNLLENAVAARKFNYAKMETDLENVMRHVNYYFPEYKPTPIYTVISDVDYRNRIIVTRDELLVSIDTYLGKDHELYAGIYPYLREHLNEPQIPVDAAMAYAKLFVEPTIDRTFLGTMVYHGKLHYLQKLFAPQATGDQLFEQAPDKHVFLVENESLVYSYFIDGNMLYSTDNTLVSRFVTPGPFSKFGLEIDRETPAGVGRYIGYRIVASYMENNEKTTLDQLLTLDAATIFNNSKYKPKQ